MAKVTINATDLITNSRADINSNFTELYNDKEDVVNKDIDTSLSSNSDTKYPSVKAVKTYIDTFGGANASETVRGIVEEATDAEVTAGTATGATGAKLFVTPTKLATRLSSILKFGGTGADGALTISSGATNIDLASAQTVTKNYSSISITGTGSLTFTNPHSNGTTIILKSQGAVTLTSSAAPMIVASGLGANRVADGYSFATFKTNQGGPGTVAPAPGSGGVLPTLSLSTTVINILSGKYPLVAPGAGGGDGNANNLASGGGGASVINTGNSGGGGVNSSGGVAGIGARGGGALIIECGGAWNFTTASGISVAGLNGANTTGSGVAGAGGGGGGGVFIALYNTLTANSGTVTTSGGSGGTGSNGASGGSGGTGYSLVVANTEFL